MATQKTLPLISLPSLCLTAFCLFGAFVPGSTLAQSECTDGESVSTSQIVSATSATCCEKSTTGKKNACIRKATAAIRRVKSIISQDIYTETRSAFNALRTSGCNVESITVPECTDDVSTTTIEALETVEEKACDLRYQSSRVRKLKKFRRQIQKARLYLGSDYSNSLKDDVSNLIGSNQCGQGGEESASSCGRIQNARDGANGNVYKLSDHSPHYPVFVTHNGARSGSVITTSGERVTGLTYTGLGNPDPAGLRHHYRFNVSCTSLPTRFYIKLGSTCYTVDNRCGRID